ncbi:hypothetical protein L207DRAFT_582682 [Hyaloscypha variabilis F]|uniref:Uncharacterized protein n=1 Tax=Hyaloscypha variabilis (strain UAMH 11265 / GT02V1 / F) TaxID=1149755 RepID=A0A2J6RPQ5_HYAVF|nr:hypothetical protein L207DRAFT_582682 [Hyaloscypha variabilis F]
MSKMTIATSDVLTIVFGLTATFLAGFASWAAHRYTVRAQRPTVNVIEPDMELVLLCSSSADDFQQEQSDNNALQVVSLSTVESRNNLHHVIEEALEVFSQAFENGQLNSVQLTRDYFGHH